MLCKPHYEKMLSKLRRFEDMINPYLFEKVDTLCVSAFEAGKTQYHSIPESENFAPIEKGFHWGGESAYCWFKSEYTVPETLDGKDIFLMPKVGGYEAMLWVNGVPFGTFNTKIVYTSHGNHYCGLLKQSVKAGEKIDIAVEYYAGHDYHGCDPFSDNFNDYSFTFESFDVCIKNEAMNDFCFDLKTVNQLASCLPDSSFMKAEAINALMKVHETVFYSPEDVSKEEFFSAIKSAHPYLKEVLSKKNADSAPRAGIIGHSHMDTAWLWHVGETVKKCARTYSNQMSLMAQYPEHHFIQSSSCHSDMIRRNYPDLFKAMQQQVKEGRYEPNGGVWVECDCNITSGESMIRQFLWGQRFNKKYFDYKSDCFWLPDTFGYSASIPQIMKGCGVDYFLTTKITWNDTNSFPYNTFHWQGIDGTKVFSHFNTTHSWADPEQLREALISEDHPKDQPTVTNERLVAYGYGDGGGGPQFEMLEVARRCEDLYDVPRAYHTTVSDFMKNLEKTAKNPNLYKGELYLELHRGTLTNQHEIKRNNRKAELKLRDLEYLTVSDSVSKGIPCSAEKTNELYEPLLINQFHDILPGTCIHRAHEECKEQMREVIAEAKKRTAEITNSEGECITLTNTLSFDRNDAAFIPDCGKAVSGVRQQCYTDIKGDKKRILSGVNVPALSSVTLAFGEEEKANSPFIISGNKLSTPFAEVTFDENGFISSFYDKSADRELVDGLPLNTFLMAEDVPMSWDNWDVDADIEMKFRPCATLLSRETVSEGAGAYVIRSKYKISEKSTLSQDMIFFASSPEVRFDTYMDWQDNHRFLKTAFDTNVREDFARHEIQFGYCKRPTTRNNTLEQAKFEVVNHKYTDLSEPGYGVCVLNDSKYGISVNGSQMRLSLHKGGCRPDTAGDHGLHHTVYAFVPHNSPFSAESVTQNGYKLNVPYVVSEGEFKAKQLLKVSAPNVFVEAIKPCEDEEKAFIIRLYEAEGTRTNCEITFSDDIKGYIITNMLEEEEGERQMSSKLTKQLRPFEILTVKAIY